MIAAILPPMTASKHKLPYVRAGSLTPSEMVLLAVLWSSVEFDWQLRTQGISGMTFGSLRDQVVATPDQLSAMLRTGLAAIQPTWLRDQAAAECGVEPDYLDWWQARAQLDAQIFRVYGFSLEEAGYVFSTFPMLDRQQQPLPGEITSTITRDLVLARFAELLGVKPPDVGELFEVFGRPPLGGRGQVDDRANRALALGAIPYVAMPQADQTRDLDEEEDEDAIQAAEEVMA
jgi:hypothetical protein